jgi:hypothetical protein
MATSHGERLHVLISAKARGTVADFGQLPRVETS